MQKSFTVTILISFFLSLLYLTTPFSYGQFDSLNQRYDNPRYGITMIYPTSWDIEEDQHNYFKITTLDQKVAFEIQLDITPFENTLDEVVSTYIKKLQEDRNKGSTEFGLPATQDLRIISTTPIEIGGLEAREIVLSDSILYDNTIYDLMTKEVMAVNEDLVYSFKYTTSDTQYENYEPIVDSMLKSITIDYQ